MPENFSVYIKFFYGVFTYGTDPYSDIPGTDLNTLKSYTDNGSGQLFDSSEFNKVVGQFFYTDNKFSGKLPTQNYVLGLLSQKTFFFPNGTINTVGSSFNETDQNGYYPVGNEHILNIVGGEGDFLNVKGNVLCQVDTYGTKATFFFE